MLLTKSEIDNIWSRIYREYNFKPSIYGAIPFEFSVPYIVYDISKLNECHLDLMQNIITQVFINCTSEGEKIYALDWQHSCFKFDPRKLEGQQSIYVKDENYCGGGYYAYFPSYYPDGDYYFFIDCNFRFGYLGHPWQQKVWIFGEDLIKEFRKVDEQIGFVKVD